MRSTTLAAKRAKSQGDVWKGVEQNQQKLAAKVSKGVLADASRSSMQLTLESRDLKQVNQAYVSKLIGIIDGKHDVMGYAFALNGEVNSADVYGSNALFKKLWPKLLESSSAEAIAERETGRTFEAPAIGKVSEFMRSADAAATGARSVQKVSKRVDAVTVETDERIFFESLDRDNRAWVHRNYIKK